MQKLKSCTVEAISFKTTIAGTLKAPKGVTAGGIFMAVIYSFCTLIDVYIKQTKNCTCMATRASHQPKLKHCPGCTLHIQQVCIQCKLSYILITSIAEPGFNPHLEEGYITRIAIWISIFTQVKECKLGGKTIQSPH